MVVSKRFETSKRACKRRQRTRCCSWNCARRPAAPKLWRRSCRVEIVLFCLFVKSALTFWAQVRPCSSRSSRFECSKYAARTAECCHGTKCIMCCVSDCVMQDANFGETSTSIAPSAVAQILPDVVVSTDSNSNATPSATQSLSGPPANGPPNAAPVAAGERRKRSMFQSVRALLSREREEKT